METTATTTTASLTWEYMSLVNELTQGMEKAKQLRYHLCSTSPSEAHDLLLRKILSSYDKALIILKWKGSVMPLESSVTVDCSPKSQDRLVQNCWATKQVQRSDEDPTVFEITYKGKHTCNQSVNAVLPPASPEKQERRNGCQHNQTLTNLKAHLRVNTENLDDSTAPPPPSSFSFSSTSVGNQYFPVPSHPYENHLGGASAYSPLFLSPATSESNYFSPAVTYPMKGFGGTGNYQHSESDIAEIISTNASTSNSPIEGMEFPFDSAEFDENFPFNTAGFFT